MAGCGEGMLEERVALVTGAGRGIGEEIALRLAGQGASVIACDLDGGAASETAAAIRNHGGQATAFLLDVTDSTSVKQAVERVVATSGRLDILVTSAGVSLGRPVLATSDEEWSRVIDVNLTGTFFCVRAAGEVMDEGARMILLSSISGRRGGPLFAAYSASKFGVIGLMQSLAVEMAARGITVNCICPGIVETQMMRELAQQRAAQLGVPIQKVLDADLADIPMRRLARPSDVADACLFLASPLSQYVTGQCVVVDGGMLF